ncbi:MAG: DNA-directed RNA polymerase subunit omega [Candidatus Sumerlaeia bacterium]|nr:DNA-directed RNA polymerase subunit omega [Candidatus Sumerlaeia bacterium]
MSNNNGQRVLDEKRLPDGDGRYMMINLAARRARQLNQDRAPMNFDEANMFDPMDAALGEFRTGKFTWRYRQSVDGDAAPDFRSVES